MSDQSKQQIVVVKAGNKGCEILADSPAQAREIKSRVATEGVWEPRNGVRWLVIHPSEVKEIQIVPATGSAAAIQGANR